MRRTIARTITRENDSFIGAVSGTDIVVIRRLFWNFRDYRSRTGIKKIADFVELPKKFIRIASESRRANDHRKNCFCPAPMYRRLTHRDSIGVLRSKNTEASSAGEIGQRAIRITNPKIVAARGMSRVREMISER